MIVIKIQFLVVTNETC